MVVRSGGLEMRFLLQVIFCSVLFFPSLCIAGDDLLAEYDRIEQANNQIVQEPSFLLSPNHAPCQGLNCDSKAEFEEAQHGDIAKVGYDIFSSTPSVGSLKSVSFRGGVSAASKKAGAGVQLLVSW